MSTCLVLLLVGRYFGVADYRMWFVPGTTQQGEICPAKSEAPPPRTVVEAEHRRKLDQALTDFWSGLEGHDIPKEEATEVANSAGKNVELQAGRNPATYGEVTPAGARQIFHAMKIDIDGEDVSFLDLGCGVGKLVVQAFLEYPRVVRATGVELSRSRVLRARTAWQSICKSGTGLSMRALHMQSGGGSTRDVGSVISAVHFQHADIFRAEISEATHVYVASLCFPDGMLERLAKKLQAEACKLQIVASLREFPRGLRGFVPLADVTAEMSWWDQPVFLYRRHDDRPQ